MFRRRFIQLSSIATGTVLAAPWVWTSRKAAAAPAGVVPPVSNFYCSVVQDASYPNYVVKPGSKITDFSNLSEWGVTPGNGTVTQDTSVHLADSAASIKVVMQGIRGKSVYLAKTFSPAISFRNGEAFAANVICTLAEAGEVSFQLYSTGSKFWAPSNTGATFPYRYTWSKMQYPYSPSRQWTGHGGITLNDPINWIYVRVFDKASPCTYWLNSCYMGGYTRPKVMIQTDDGYSSDYTYMKDACLKRGLTATFFVSGDNVDKGNGMTGAQLRELESLGFEIGGHGKNVLSSYVTESTLRNELTKQLTAVRNAGCSVENYAYPGGRFVYGGGMNDAITIPTMLKEEFGVKTARTVHGNIFRPDWALDQAPLDPYFLNGFGVATTTTATTALDVVDLAIRTGCSICIYWHRVVASGATGATRINQSVANAILDGIQSRVNLGLCDCVTVRDFMHNRFAGL